MIAPRDVADRLALKKYPRSWRGNCPSCGYPGSFALKEARSGALLFCSNGCDREVLSKMVMGATAPAAPRYDEAADKSKATRTDAALRLWRGSLPLDRRGAEPGVTYLQARGIEHVAGCPALRFRSDTRHPEGGSLAALIALVVDVDGAPIAIHRTYLTRDGSAKSKVTPQKAGLGPTWGGAVRLSEPISGSALVVGEGIETSAAAGRLMALPSWAALSAGNLAGGLHLPPDIRHVIIAADHDMPLPNGRRPGQDAAAQAASRWRAEGRHVEIRLPDRPGSDFADLLLERIRRGR